MNETKEKIINALIKQKCFVFGGGPYTSSGGFKVPFFIDVRPLFSDPEILRFIAKELLEECRKNDISILAGAETAGIPFASAMSVQGDLPMFYVRKAKQSHGMESVIAGTYPKETDRIALIDDSIGGGGSAKIFIENLEKEGFKVKLLLYVLEMDIWNNSKERMNQLCEERPGLKYHYLVTWSEWINYMYDKGLMSETLKNICLESAKTPLLFSDVDKMEWYKKEEENGNIWFKEN